MSGQTCFKSIYLFHHRKKKWKDESTEKTQMQSGAEAQKERQDNTRQDKTLIIVTLQVQLFGTQLARKR